MQVCIFCSAGLASRRRRQLSSNVRPHTKHLVGSRSAKNSHMQSCAHQRSCVSRARHGMGAEAPSSVRSKSPSEAVRVRSPSKSSASREPLAALDARFQSQFVGPPPRGAVWLRPAWLVAAGVPPPRPVAPEFAPSAVLWPARWSTRAASPSPDRGRDAHYWAPPAQIRTCPIKAFGSHLGFD